MKRTTAQRFTPPIILIMIGLMNTLVTAYLLTAVAKTRITAARTTASFVIGIMLLIVGVVLFGKEVRRAK